LNAAYEVRKKYWGRDVTVHILNNVQNGSCSEDCSYCAQSAKSKAEIKSYPMKNEAEIMEEARVAYESGAFRYCMVFSGRGPSAKRIDKLTNIIKEIKKRYPIEVCVSPGKIDKKDAERLKAAGLDRLNHNLNTSESYYSEICSTHKYQERFKTIEAAKSVGLEVCSGLIVGMDESIEDIIEVALKLRSIDVKSIPVNFFIPIPGIKLKVKTKLTPEYCLRVLCLFRFLNPKAEIRAAAGRELHLRNMQSLALYPANSIFMDGYLNTDGSNAIETLQIIKDAGFRICSTKNLDDLLNKLS
jgi:biotin synthase